VDDLIELARQGQAALKLTPTRLDLLAADVLDRVGQRAAPTTITIRGEPCPVLADEDALSRAIANLVNNAIAWTPPDGTITVTTGHDHQQCWVEVADTGPGIPAEDLPRIFERFYRAPAARSKPGSGLGLAIVAQIAAQHHGHATAQSNADGTRIRLSIPDATRPTSSAPVPPRILDKFEAARTSAVTPSPTAQFPPSRGR
jgi:two-component system sensor histidine kinase MprB